jgi:hypothetical protein
MKAFEKEFLLQLCSDIKEPCRQFPVYRSVHAVMLILVFVERILPTTHTVRMYSGPKRACREKPPEVGRPTSAAVPGGEVQRFNWWWDPGKWIARSASPLREHNTPWLNLKESVSVEYVERRSCLHRKATTVRSIPQAATHFADPEKNAPYETHCNHFLHGLCRN